MPLKSKLLLGLYGVLKLSELILQFVLMYIASKYMFVEGLFAVTLVVNGFILIINLLVTLESVRENIRTLSPEICICCIFGGCYTLLLVFQGIYFKDEFRSFQNINYFKQNSDHKSVQVGIKSLMVKGNNTSTPQKVEGRDLITELIVAVILFNLQIASCCAWKFYLKSSQTNPSQNNEAHLVEEQPVNENEFFENANDMGVGIEVSPSFLDDDQQSSIVSIKESEDPSRNLSKNEKDTFSVDTDSPEVTIFNEFDDKERLVLTSNNSKDPSRNLSNIEEVSSDSDSSELVFKFDDMQNLVDSSKKSKCHSRKRKSSGKVSKSGTGAINKTAETEESNKKFLNLTKEKSKLLEERVRQILLSKVEKVHVRSSMSVKPDENVTDCVNGETSKAFIKGSDSRKTEKRVRFDSITLSSEAVGGLEVGKKTVISADKEIESVKE